MNVVTSAITTSIVKRLREMRPRSSPMLSTISSVRPRVFMRAGAVFVFVVVADPDLIGEVFAADPAIMHTRRC
jgi:hypothetical protein